MSQAGSLGVGGSGRSTTVAVSTFQPNVVLQEFDDFLSENGNSKDYKLNWQQFLTAPGFTNGTTDHPGIATTKSYSHPDGSGLFLGTTFNPIVFGGGVTSVSFIVQIPTLSTGINDFNYYCGLADGNTLSGGTTAFVDGAYFKYNHALNAGQWTLNTTNTSVTTTVNTATAVTTGWTTLNIVANANDSSISFYINNVLVGTNTTNLPTAAISPMVFTISNAGTIPATNVDLFYIDIALTNPRPGPTFSQAVVGTGQLVEQYVQTPISYQVLNTDAIIGVSSTAAARTITMPASSLVTGQRWTIKDESGACSVNNITISGNGKNIDGAATYVMNTNYAAVDLYYSGSNFFII